MKPPNLRRAWSRSFPICLLGRPDTDHAVFEVDLRQRRLYARPRPRYRHPGWNARPCASLRRIAVGPFREEQAISLERFLAFGHSAAAFEALLPIETVLDDIPALALTGPEADRLRRGQAIPLIKRSDLPRVEQLEPGATVFATLCRTAGGFDALRWRQLEAGPGIQSLRTEGTRCRSLRERKPSWYRSMPPRTAIPARPRCRLRS